MRARVLRFTFGALVVFAIAAAGVSARQNTATLNVTATVIKNCDISTSDVAFGQYDPLGANLTTDLTGTGTITMRCTLGEAPRIDIDVPGGGRIMTGGTGSLNYQLYKEGGRTTPWTTGASGGVTAAQFATDQAQTLTVYGLIPRAQNVPAGSYSHQLTVTVNF